MGFEITWDKARLAVTCAVVLALAGCAKGMEVGSITEIKAPPGSQGVDVYAAQRAAGQTVPDFAGDQIVEVRTYFADNDDYDKGEFTGANCKLTSSNFSADFVTPAKVRVPIYRAQSSQLAVQCEKQGFKPRLVETAAVNETKQGTMAAGAGAGAIGLVTALVINAVSDEKTHNFAYPAVRIEMEKIKPASRVAAENKT